MKARRALLGDRRVSGAIACPTTSNIRMSSSMSTTRYEGAHSFIFEKFLKESKSTSWDAMRRAINGGKEWQQARVSAL